MAISHVLLFIGWVSLFSNRGQRREISTPLIRSLDKVDANAIRRMDDSYLANQTGPVGHIFYRSPQYPSVVPPFWLNCSTFEVQWKRYLLRKYTSDFCVCSSRWLYYFERRMLCREKFSGVPFSLLGHVYLVLHWLCKSIDCYVALISNRQRNSNPCSEQHIKDIIRRWLACMWKFQKKKSQEWKSLRLTVRWLYLKSLQNINVTM